MRRFYTVFIKNPSVYLLGLFLFSCQKQSTEDVNILVEPGLKVERFVAEPLVMDPVAFTFDEQGRLYVVEDRGYPDPAEGGIPDKKEGRIALLQDLDDDGRYEHRSEFVGDLTYPNGIMSWRGGVFVTCAPDIYYFRDTTGDGVADQKDVVLTGFFDTRTAQIRTSHPTLGLDGWVYVTSGLNGGNISSPLYPDRPAVSFTASDGRFNPDSYEFETVGGKSQFGLTFDAWGNRFGVSNRNPIMQVVIEPAYLNRNPWLASNETVKNVSKVAAEAVVFPLHKVVTTSDYIPTLMGRSHQGTFTAASSTYIYYGRGLPVEHQGNAFVCESAQNLMQRQVLQKDGPAYSAVIPYRDREFLASEDEWFRPVFVNTGPDDALYVVDMHRKVIDHPSYVPEEVRDQIDFVSGKDKGRIYRITKKDNEAHPDEDYWFSGEESSEQLVARMGGNFEWENQTAFRLLLQNEEVKPQAVIDLFHSSQNSRQKVKALWLLDDKGLIDDVTLSEAFHAKDPVVRLQGVRLAGNQASVSSNLRNELIKAAEDTDMQVRLASALVLGSIDGDDVVRSLADIALRDGDDLWIREAVLSGVSTRMATFFDAIVHHKDFATASPELLRETGEMFGLGGSLQACRKIAQDILKQAGVASDLKFSTWLGLIKGLQQRKDSPQGRNVFNFLMEEVNQTNQQAFKSELVEKANQESDDIAGRSRALVLLGHTQITESMQVFRMALRSTEPLEIQKAAVSGIFAGGSEKMAKILLEQEIWKGMGPEIRSQVVSSLVANDQFIPVLLSAISQGTIKASDVPAVYRNRLMNSANGNIAARAKEVFQAIESGDRMQIYERYKRAINNEGDAVSGQVIFQQACAVCHTYAGEGGNVGPDLTSINNQPTEAILLHILLPNYEVYPTYQTVMIQTSENQYLAGWMMNETSNAITLKTAAGNDETVLRSNITLMENTGQSLMPEGLENAIDEKKMNDLIAYLKKGSLYNN
ncbi:MAG: HEAT repeat domain-containing protein [Saprospiraceae bacterium]|nr:HEAT repeat domain-containing protein [Saprospiraceae bacterium]